MGKAVHFEAMGEAEREASARQAKAAALDAENRRQVLRESCCECGSFGPWSDGAFHFCAEHVSDELRHPARFLQQSKVA